MTTKCFVTGVYIHFVGLYGMCRFRRYLFLSQWNFNVQMGKWSKFQISCLWKDMRTVVVKYFPALMKHLSVEFINLVAAGVLISFWVLVTNRSIFSSKGHLKVPEELKFSNACCVGIASQTVLSIYNPSDRWLQVNIGILSVSVNGEKVRVFFFS